MKDTCSYLLKDKSLMKDSSSTSMIYLLPEKSPNFMFLMKKKSSLMLLEQKLRMMVSPTLEIIVGIGSSIK